MVSKTIVISSSLIGYALIYLYETPNMEKFGTILCIIGFLILICLFEYSIYALFGWIGAIVYAAIVCILIGGSIIMMD